MQPASSEVDSRLRHVEPEGPHHVRLVCLYNVAESGRKENIFQTDGGGHAVAASGAADGAGPSTMDQQPVLRPGTSRYKHIRVEPVQEELTRAVDIIITSSSSTYMYVHVGNKS